MKSHNSSNLIIENREFEDTNNPFIITLSMLFLYLFILFLMKGNIDTTNNLELYCYYFVVSMSTIFGIILIYICIKRYLNKSINKLKFIEISENFVHFYYKDSTKLSIENKDISSVNVSNSKAYLPSNGLVKKLGSAGAIVPANTAVLEWQLHFKFNIEQDDIILKYCPLEFLADQNNNFIKDIKSTKLYKICKINFSNKPSE